MKKEILNSIEYNKEYYEKAFVQIEKRHSYYHNKVSNVLELIDKISKNEKILDVGTCSGTFAFICAKKGALAYGTDLSKQAIDYCNNKKKRERIENVIFKVASAERQPFKSNYFDKIVMGDIVEHLPNKLFKETIKECYRMLKMSGKLIIYTPNREHIFEFLKRHNFILKEEKTHINLMKMEGIKKVLYLNNFKIEQAYFKPSHIREFNVLELIFSHIPLIGKYFKRRICIVARK